MPNINRATRGIITALAAGSFWGLTGLFVRYFQKIGITSMQMVFLRMLVTSVVMLCILLIREPQLLRVKIKDCWCFIGNGVCSLLMFSLCYFQAIQLSSLSVAAVLMYTAPIIVMILSLFLFRETMTRVKLIACALSFIGCVFVAGLIGDGTLITVPALLAGLGSGLGYALYSIFTRFAINKKYHSLTIVTYSFIVAFIGTVPLTDIQTVFQTIAANPFAILMTVLMGLISAVFPYLLYTHSLTCIDSSRASIVASIEPVVATIAGMIVFHEFLDIWGILGIILVVTSLIVLNVKPKSHVYAGNNK